MIRIVLEEAKHDIALSLEYILCLLPFLYLFWLSILNLFSLFVVLYPTPIQKIIKINQNSVDTSSLCGDRAQKKLILRGVILLEKVMQHGYSINCQKAYHGIAHSLPKSNVLIRV